jgi:FkbM family methyltransferase
MIKYLNKIFIQDKKIAEAEFTTLSNQSFEKHSIIQDKFPWIDLLVLLGKEDSDYLLELVAHSKSQLGQDLLVAHLTRKIARPKYFVEFGAANGLHHSNTWLLEKKLGWQGILAEPARCWHKKLLEERSSTIDFRCVASVSGKEVDFLEVEGGEVSNVLSTIAEYASKDCHSNLRTSSNKEYKVETISLVDLLKFHNAPEIIDYISIDTEGSELEIINHFDFSKYRISIISIEHNLDETYRKNIFDKLTEFKFKRVFEKISKFDDWYVSEENIKL